jgi:predicted TPR repeat methyltransferase
MDITEQDVEDIDSARETVNEILAYARENDTDVFRVGNLEVLSAQLDSLHQALSVIVAQKKQ